MFFFVKKILRSKGERKREMLTCIACSKQVNTNNGGSKDEEEDDDRTPRSKQTIKSLTSQVDTILLLYQCHFHEMVKRKETARQDLF